MFVQIQFEQHEQCNVFPNPCIVYPNYATRIKCLLFNILNFLVCATMALNQTITLTATCTTVSSTFQPIASTMLQLPILVSVPPAHMEVTEQNGKTTILATSKDAILSLPKYTINMQAGNAIHVCRIYINTCRAQFQATIMIPLHANLCTKLH